MNEFLLAKFAARAGIEPGHALAEWTLVFAPAQEQLIARAVLFPDVAPALARLKAAGLGLAVATNYGPSVRMRLHALGIGPLIDVWGLAPEMRVPKPEPAFFARVLELLQVAPSQAVMVGDRQDNDIAPAKRSGLKAVRLRRGLHKEQRPRGLADAPDFSAATFREAADWVLERAR